MRPSDRLFQIIQILRRSRRPLTAEAIAAELETSKRTIYRDISTLIGQRVPIRGEAGLGYILEGGFDLPPLMLTSDEWRPLPSAPAGCSRAAIRPCRGLRPISSPSLPPSCRKSCATWRSIPSPAPGRPGSRPRTASTSPRFEAGSTRARRSRSATMTSRAGRPSASPGRWRSAISTASATSSPGASCAVTSAPSAPTASPRRPSWRSATRASERAPGPVAQDDQGELSQLPRRLQRGAGLQPGLLGLGELLLANPAGLRGLGGAVGMASK